MNQLNSQPQIAKKNGFPIPINRKQKFNMKTIHFVMDNQGEIKDNYKLYD